VGARNWSATRSGASWVPAPVTLPSGLTSWPTGTPRASLFCSEPGRRHSKTYLAGSCGGLGQQALPSKGPPTSVTEAEGSLDEPQQRRIDLLDLAGGHCRVMPEQAFPHREKPKVDAALEGRHRNHRPVTVGASRGPALASHRSAGVRDAVCARARGLGASLADVTRTGEQPAAAQLAGRRTRNAAPPVADDSRRSEPRCWVTMEWTIAKPSPVPWALVVKNGWKILSR
jgi:hypothetical protein